MTAKEAISINGQQYDPVTGLPQEGSSTEPSVNPSVIVRASHHTPAGQLHSTTQRSITLHRKSLKKPTHAIHRRTAPVRKSMDIHPGVRKFAPHPVDAITPKPPVQQPVDVGPVAHPHVVKAHAKSFAKEQQSLSSRLPTASETKAEVVKQAVANTHKSTKHRTTLSERMAPRQRVAAILSAAFALVLLGGYFTYLNMPALSVRVAAAQAGIDASYPNYHPDGYALTGPVTFSDGRVSMNFKANTGDQTFSISQSKSGWNNEAVLDNYVTPRAGVSYLPYTERGLTIYTFDDSAAWVNGGILYTIEGNAPLSSEQIRRIATSLL